MLSRGALPQSNILGKILFHNQTSWEKSLKTINASLITNNYFKKFLIPIAPKNSALFFPTFPPFFNAPPIRYSFVNSGNIKISSPTRWQQSNWRLNGELINSPCNWVSFVYSLWKNPCQNFFLSRALCNFQWPTFTLLKT